MNAERLRVGRIRFANCTPLFRALEEQDTRGVEYVEGVPTELNAMLRSGEVDLSPSSSVECLLRPALYGFLPDLSISAIGPVASVLLFSCRPMEGLDGCSVGVSPDSATSAALLRVVLEGHLGIRPVYGEPRPGCEAVLWIGDRALREARARRWRHVYDLGDVWFRRTGTPFVFALWICRREAFAGRPEAVRGFYRSLVQARHRAYRSYPAYARSSPEAAWLGEAELLDYWQTISYDLTAWHREGLRRFAEEAAALGIVPSPPLPQALPVEEWP